MDKPRIAVIGAGLMKLYPPENAGLAEKIRSGNGAIVSEFSMEIDPDRQTFPMRNRIIAGWSHGVLVVEAGLNSGALITASQAIEQGRSVYAVPGHINAPSAQGSRLNVQSETLPLRRMPLGLFPNQTDPGRPE